VLGSRRVQEYLTTVKAQSLDKINGIKLEQTKTKCMRLGQNKRDMGDKNAQYLDKITGIREEQTKTTTTKQIESLQGWTET